MLVLLLRAFLRVCNREQFGQGNDAVSVKVDDIQDANDLIRQPHLGGRDRDAHLALSRRRRDRSHLRSQTNASVSPHGTEPGDNRTSGCSCTWGGEGMKPLGARACKRSARARNSAAVFNFPAVPGQMLAFGSTGGCKGLQFACLGAGGFQRGRGADWVQIGINRTSVSAFHRGISAARAPLQSRNSRATLDPNALPTARVLTYPNVECAGPPVICLSPARSIPSSRHLGQPLKV
jgi:hypothetical protein